jgi:transcriptional regulator GlxA family with amidase domain
MERKSVAIVLFQDIEVLDFCGPFEVFATTRLNEAKRQDEPSPFEVLLVAEHPGPVTTSGGMTVMPHYTFENCPRLDILVVPGGWGTRQELNNPIMLAWLQARAQEVELLTAVCTGSMLLGFAGLLHGLHATTHWRSLDWMRAAFPSVTVEYQQHVVEDGRVLTSAGIAAGIDMALKVVERCCGGEIARATAKHMEYAFPDSNARRIEF